MAPPVAPSWTQGFADRLWQNSETVVGNARRHRWGKHWMEGHGIKGKAPYLCTECKAQLQSLPNLWGPQLLEATR